MDCFSEELCGSIIEYVLKSFGLKETRAQRYQRWKKMMEETAKKHAVFVAGGDTRQKWRKIMRDKIPTDFSAEEQKELLRLYDKTVAEYAPPIVVKHAPEVPVIKVSSL